jgi:hypothetical protein
MRRCSPGSFLPFLVASMALATTALGQPRDSGVSGTTAPRAYAEAHPANEWPCQLVIDAELKPFAMQAWERSPTFRKQCDILAAANAIVIVRSASAGETMKLPRLCTSSVLRRTTAFAASLAALLVMAPTPGSGLTSDVQRFSGLNCRRRLIAPPEIMNSPSPR